MSALLRVGAASGDRGAWASEQSLSYDLGERAKLTLPPRRVLHDAEVADRRGDHLSKVAQPKIATFKGITVVVNGLDDALSLGCPSSRVVGPLATSFCWSGRAAGADVASIGHCWSPSFAAACVASPSESGPALTSSNCSTSALGRSDTRRPRRSGGSNEVRPRAAARRCPE